MEHGEGRDRDKGFAAMPANTAGGKPSPWNLYRSPHDECVMKRDRVLEETRRGLAKTGFFLSRPHGERGLCFDFVARRDDTLLIVKVLQNVDALSKDTAHELLEVARILEGSPLVVGERSGTGSLEDGVIYTRFGVSILSRRTLGVPVDPFALLADPAPPEERLPHLEGFEREMFERLERLGYQVLRTVRSPFDALSKHEDTTFLTGVGDADRALERKAEVVSNLSRVVGKDSVMFVERARVRMSTRGVPVIARADVARAEDRDDVEEMISERKG